MEFKKLERIDSALEKFLKKIKVMETEKTSVYNCSNRVLDEDVVATIDVPPFDRAAMDGYAVIAEDTFGASQENPIILKVVGKIEAGDEPKIEIKRGEAVEISTGSAIPKGANAVVMVEYTRRIGDFVEIFKAVPPFKNVSLKGEDIKEGEVVLKRGEVLQPQDAGVIASLGISEVRVYRKPRVAIISTGNELVPINKKLERGKIYSSNDVSLVNALREFSEPINMGIARDDEKEIEEILMESLKFDAVIFTGGTSVGKKDLVPKVVERYAELAFHGLAIRPAMPSGAAVYEGKPIFMLPGSPAAAMISYHAIVEPTILAMQNVKIVKRKWEKVKGILQSPVPSEIGIRSFVRVLWKDGKIYPVRLHGSSVLSSLVKANALLIVPEEVEGYQEGEEVEAVLIRYVTELLR